MSETTSRLAAALAIVLLAAFAVRAAGPPGRTDPLTGETAYSVAMHMHSSFSEGSGSMEWHTNLAQQFGVDVIWWTDHDWRISHRKQTKGYDFETAFLDTVENRIEAPDEEYQGEFKYWELAPPQHDDFSFSIVDSVKFQGAHSLRLSLEQAFPGPFFSPGYLTQTTSAFQNVCSLSGRVTLRFAMKPVVLDPVDSRFVLQVGMSDHPDGQKIFRWVAGTQDGEGGTTFVLPYSPGVWNAYTLDITSGAIIFFTSGGADSVRGEDNALFDVRVGLETRNNKIPIVFFDDYRIGLDSTMTAVDLLNRQRAMASYYETQYPSVRQLVGSEMSLFAAQPHMNAFAPNHTLIDYGTHIWSDSIYYAIDQVHAQGGAVSLNHIFGPTIYGDTTETPAHKAARIKVTKEGLIGNRCWGVDLFETGYRWRGGMNLQEHLGVWDAMTANAVFVTGNGVTDSHGPYLFNGWGPHQPGNPGFENNFVTWLYSLALNETDFVQAMKSGRAYFGDPYRFDGTIDLKTPQGLRMGQVVLTDHATEDVIVTVSAVPVDVQVRLLQFEIRENPPVPYLVPNVLRDELLTGTVNGGVFSDTVSIDVSVPSFVRVEVSGSAGEEWAFSNPLHFVSTVPALGIPGPRVGAHLDEVRIVEAQNFTLTGASMTPGAAAELSISGDEDPPGLGTIRVGTGTLGAPSSVSGAASWNFVNDFVILQGFGGAGASVVLRWGPVAASEMSAPPDFGLEPGRPNPFGEGFEAAFAIPRRDRVRLDVYDVAGRLVRRLLDAEREAGRHVLTWDGRDESGREVANGIYLLRLESGGRTLTTRAVKLR